MNIQNSHKNLNNLSNLVDNFFKNFFLKKF